MSVNKVILIGRLGQDPEVRQTAGGNSVASLSIATDESWTDKNGERQKKTEWHRVVAWGRTAELCGEYLKKGREVYIEGRLETRKWQDKDGQDRYTTEIKADAVKFIGGRDDGDGKRPSGQGQQQPAGGGFKQAPPPDIAGIGDDEMPF